MSAVHHHSSWGATSSGLTRGRIELTQGNPTSFSAKKRSVALSLMCYEQIAKRTLDNVRARALDMIKAPATGSAGFRVGTASSIEDVAASFIPVADDSKSSAKKGPKDPAQAQMASLCALTRLSPTEYTVCVKMAKTFAMNYFTGIGNPVFAYSSKKAEIERWHAETTLAMINFGYASLGMSRSSDPVRFSDEDLAFFGITASPVDPATISCLSFALLQAKERGAAGVIFNRTSADAALYDVDNYLRGLKYRTVDAPDEGDLVVYFNKGKPMHVGYFGEDGRVHSKLGLANPYSHHHRLFDVFPAFGNDVVFYRKSPALFSDEELAAEEGKAEK